MEFAKIVLRKCELQIGDSVVISKSDDYDSFTGEVYAIQKNVENTWVHIFDENGYPWEITLSKIKRIIPKNNK